MASKIHPEFPLFSALSSFINSFFFFTVGVGQGIETEKIEVKYTRDIERH